MRLLVRRLLDALVLLWIVVTLTFVLLRAAPGDPAALLVPPTATAADAARARTPRPRPSAVGTICALDRGPSQG